MALIKSKYRYETELVSDFLNSIHLFPKQKITTSFKEFNYKRGRADICALNTAKELISIEAKLKNWKVALHQAFKNTSYSHYSYILVPENIVHLLLKGNVSCRYDIIGIITMGENGISLVREAVKNVPFQPWLTNEAKSLCEASIN